jgi:hypothetical protein
MSRRKSRYDEIIILIVPQYARTGLEQVAETSAPATEESDNPVRRFFKWLGSSSGKESPHEAHTYDAFVYTNLTIPGLEASEVEPSECANEISGLSLVGCGQIIVHWEHYHKYLRTFTLGEKAAYQRFWGVADVEKQQSMSVVKVRDQLFKIPTRALRDLFYGKLKVSDQPLRIWLQCNPPELADLPWEILSCQLRKKEKARFSFVRGLPPAPLPKVPVQGKLRLAFIHEPRRTPDALMKAMESLKTTLDVVEMTESTRDALKRAASDGFELVHLVTDGALSLGHDGLLYLRESADASSGEPSDSAPLNPLTYRLYRLALNNVDFFKHLLSEQRLLDWNRKLIDKLDLETCSAEELSTVLRGSRVTLLSFSTPRTDDRDPARFDGTLLPTVYSAFASLGNSALLPNVVAPLGACDDKTLEKFWSSFYAQLMNPSPQGSRRSSRSFSLEEALAVGHDAAPTALMALFLRQRLGREFTTRVVKIGETDEEPTRANAKLQVERSLIEQLRAIDSNYMDIESKISDTPLAQAETARQYKLEQEIDSLAQLEEEE